MFSKNVKVEQSFNSSGRLFHKLAALNINDRCRYDCLILGSFNPFAPGDFAEKRVLKLVEWFSGHCRAIKS